MEKSTKILIGFGVVGVVGLLIYNKAKAAAPTLKSGGVGKKPSNTTPKSDNVPIEIDNPIIDPISGKLVPPKPTTPKKPLPSEKDTTNPNTNPKFDTNKGIGSGGGGSTPSSGKGGGDGIVNDPDLSSGRMKKYDPNAKDENWIKALQKKQKSGNQNPNPNKKGKKQKETPRVDCYTNPYDPTCQKVKDCYYNPNDPSCSDGKYDYSYDYSYDYGYDNNTYDYETYDNNKYNYDYGNYDYNGGYDYVGGYDYSGGYNYSGGGYDIGGGNYRYSYDSGYYENNYSVSEMGRGGNPSDYNDWY